MSRFEKILLATNFSHSSRRALGALITIQQVYKAEVWLLHVIVSFWKNFFAAGAYEKEAKQRLRGWQHHIPHTPHDARHLNILKGHASTHILQTANAFKTDLIVMGGESERTRGRYLTGSTAEFVVKRAKQSVWLAKNDTITRVLCAVDGSDASAKALSKAIEICRHFSASLLLLNVIPLATFNPLGMGEDEILAEERAVKQRHIKKIQQFYADFDFDGIQAKYFYPWGKPGRVILDCVEDLSYDLLVIGATGSGKIRQALLGSTAETILRRTSCSLLVVR